MKVGAQHAHLVQVGAGERGVGEARIVEKRRFEIGLGEDRKLGALEVFRPPGGVIR
jgi:hypothetical protein